MIPVALRLFNVPEGLESPILLVFMRLKRLSRLQAAVLLFLV